MAVCAWLLPAISGSYVLLTLGLYNAVIDALANFDLPVLVSLAAGCGVGLLVFARLLSWLLHHYSEPLLSLLIGFMLGSLPKLWPWQDLAQSGVLAKLLHPAQYAAGPAYLGGTLITFAAGVVVLWLLTRLTDHK